MNIALALPFKAFLLIAIPVDCEIWNGIVDPKPYHHHHHHVFKANKTIDGSIGSLIQQLHGTDTYLMVKESLKMFNNTSLNVTNECKSTVMSLYNDIIKNILNPLKLMTLPGAKMIDAWGKIPERILLGNFMWMGAYDECTDTHGAKYCVTPITLKGAPPGTLVTYGSCFPKECTNADVKEVMKMLKVGPISPIASASKCNKVVTYSTGAVVTIVIISIIILLNIIGTIADAIAERRYSQIQVIDVDDAGLSSENLQSHSVQSSTTTIDHLPKTTSQTKIHCPNSNSFFLQILTCFSVPRNIQSILSTDVAKGSITCVNGIRFFSMTWVVLGHYYAFDVLGARPDNIITAMKVTQRFSFQAVANAYVSVDSFFLLSGLLVGYLTFKKLGDKTMKIKHIPMMYVHRYIRLTPTLALVILFETNLFQNILSGPGKLVNQMFLSLTRAPNPDENCYNYWWATLLYFNNLYPDISKNCFGLAWYLANDFQFFALSPFIIMVMVVIHRNYAKLTAIGLNFVFISVLCSISMLITGIITGVYNIPSLLTASFLPNNPRKDQAKWIMERLYVKPYTRITPYLIGIFLGYLINKKVSLKSSSKGKMISTIGWSLATILACLVIYGPYSVFREDGSFFTNSQNIMYSATHRFLWSCALAWVVYTCHNKYGGWVDSLLSWKAWIPISRLTYGGYLLHLMVMGFFMQIRDVPYHYQDSTAVQGVISIVVVTYGFSFMLAVFVEFPISQLEKMLFGR